jgi:putative ABC transport system permease protein
MEVFKLAWRNLWRNKRRTIITTASVFFAIMLSLIMRAFQLGSYDLMTSNIVHSYSGYFQIHAKGYWDEKVINNSFEMTPGIRMALGSDKRIKGYALRLESYVLASYGTQTKGVLVNGIIPSEENTLTSLQKRLTEGKFLTEKDSGALVGQGLAKFLKIHTGDTLVLIGQGFHGESAAGIFRVKGIVHFGSPDLDKQMVYLSLPRAQSLLSANDLLTSVAVNLTTPDDYDKIAADFTRLLDQKKYEVMTWKEMMPEVVQEIQADNASGLIMLGILYMVVGFGIFGTVLMMLNERVREFGVIIAIGMQRNKLISIVITEMIFLGILGILAGILFDIPLIYYFHSHPISLSGDIAQSTLQMGFEPVMPAAWKISFFLNQSLIIFIIILLIMIYPVVKLLRFNLIEALRH